MHFCSALQSFIAIIFYLPMKKIVYFFMANLVILLIEPLCAKDLPGSPQDVPCNVTHSAITSQDDHGTATKNRTRGAGKMDIHLKAEDINEIQVNVGDKIFLESLRQAVVPPYLMIMPFYDLPEFFQFVEARPLDEDGVHGTVFVFDVKSSGQGELTVGFKDMQNGTITHKKVLRCSSSDVN